MELAPDSPIWSCQSGAVWLVILILNQIKHGVATGLTGGSSILIACLLLRRSFISPRRSLRASGTRETSMQTIAI